MGGDHEHALLGDLVDLVDEDRSQPFEALHDVAVVDDLLAHVDGRPVALEGALHDVDGALDAGAERAGPGQGDATGGGGTGPARQGGSRLAQRTQGPGDAVESHRAQQFLMRAVADDAKGGEGPLGDMTGHPGRFHVGRHGARLGQLAAGLATHHAVRGGRRRRSAAGPRRRGRPKERPPWRSPRRGPRWPRRHRRCAAWGRGRRTGRPPPPGRGRRGRRLPRPNGGPCRNGRPSRRPSGHGGPTPPPAAGPAQ